MDWQLIVIILGALIFGFFIGILAGGQGQYDDLYQTGVQDGVNYYGCIITEFEYYGEEEYEQLQLDCSGQHIQGMTIEPQVLGRKI